MAEQNLNMNNSSKFGFEIKKLSPHLFWDVDRAQIDATKNKQWLINRVLEYGKLSDWLLLIKMYGINEIADVAVTLRDIDIRTITLISVISGVPKEKFLCYNTRQLIPPHWNF